MNAEERAWEVVRRAYEDRIPAQRRTAPSKIVLLGLAAALVVAAAVFSPPGRAVFRSVREAVGVEHAQPALFSLPAPGRLLVVSRDGPWVVQGDGSKRRLGDYAGASWSPHGLFVVVTKGNEVRAVEPDGTVRWSLARPGARDAVWGGSRTDTRIAYVDRDGLRVVAGDGTGDRLLDARGRSPAWRPGDRHVLAYLRGAAVVRVDTDTGVREIRRLARRPFALRWTRDGRRLLALDANGVSTLDGRRVPFRGRVVDAAVSPNGAVAVAVRRGGQSEVRLLDGRRLFAGAGEIAGVAWSPDGRWALVDWRTANQWLFLHGARVRAVANIARQFGGAPRLATWCCPP